MSGVKQMNLGEANIPTTDPATMQKLEELQVKLMEVLGEINKIAPVQFLDWESEYVYNLLGLRLSPSDNRVWVVVSGRNDNLPAHAANPLRDSRGQIMPPCELPMIQE